MYNIPNVLLLASKTDNGSWPFDNVLAKIMSLTSLDAKFRNVWFSARGLFDVVIWPKSVSRLINVLSFEPWWVDEGPG
jgi:hypothetical protein